MNLYDQIAHNKRKTIFLVSLFGLIILALGYFFGVYYADPYVGIIGAGMVATFMSLVSYFAGDKVALATAGAKRITKQDNFTLYTLVENLAITAGLPTPAVYLVNDPAANAFATGRSPENASIAVTTGLLQLLDKQELEGVLAHEMSHIKNYDIRVMTIVIVLVGAIILFSDILVRPFFFRDRDSNSGQLGVILLIAGFALAILSPLVAELIKLAVSRSREYLADASGALLCRHPDALANALTKIAKQDRPMARANHATAHLFLANPFDPHVTKKFERLFSTHPPIEERIARLRTMGQ